MEVLLTIFRLFDIRVLLLDFSHRFTVVKLVFHPHREVDSLAMHVLLSYLALLKQLFSSLVPVFARVHVLLPNESLSSLHSFSLDVVSSLREQITKIK